MLDDSRVRFEEDDGDRRERSHQKDRVFKAVAGAINAKSPPDEEMDGRVN